MFINYLRGNGGGAILFFVLFGTEASGFGTVVAIVVVVVVIVGSVLDTVIIEVVSVVGKSSRQQAKNETSQGGPKVFGSQGPPEDPIIRPILQASQQSYCQNHIDILITTWFQC